jgi:PEP-CTERM motif
MKIKNTLLVAALVIGGSAIPASAGLITWQLNGIGSGGGIAYGDGSSVTGTVSWDTTANAWSSVNTIAVTDPNWAGTPPSGCAQAQPCTGVMQPGTTWYVDPSQSAATGLLMVNVNPLGNTVDLTGASYFFIVAAQTFDGTDYTGGSIPANTGTGNPAAQYNEMVDDDYNGLGIPTVAGTCADFQCDSNDGPAHDVASLIDFQGTDTAWALSTCPADNTPQDNGNTCTNGPNGGQGGTGFYDSAYFSTVIPAGPAVIIPGDAPEPSTFFLLGGSLLAVGIKWRKRFSVK